MYGGQAADADRGGADTACGQRRDGASRLARMSIRAGRYVPISGDLPSQSAALESPERPRGGAGPAAEFTGQFRFRRQPGPRRVFAAPDPPREHGVNVQPGPRTLPRIIHDQPHGQCKRLQPGGPHVIHLEHPRVAAPTDGLRAGDDHTRYAAQECVRPMRLRSQSYHKKFPMTYNSSSMRLDKGTLIIAACAAVAAVILGALSSAVSGVLSALAGLVSTALWQIAVDRRARRAEKANRMLQAKHAYSIPVAVAHGSAARYLRPEAKVVPFWPRPELHEVLSWVRSPDLMAVQLITGAGGSGKTRLIFQVAELVAQEGWQVQWIRARAEGVAAAAANDSSGPVLLVVDYAETRSDLEAMLADIIAGPDRPPRRVILLARSMGEWWQQLINRSAYQLSELLADVAPIELGPLSGTSDQSKVFAAALSAFAKALEVPCPEVTAAPQEADAVVLVIHTSALLAILDSMDSAAEVRVSNSSQEALTGILRHEERYWEQSHAVRGLSLDPTDQRRVVAVACLIGADDEGSALELVRRTSTTGDPALRTQVARWIHDLYPVPASVSSAEWIGQLRPDLLAERLVVNAFSQRLDLMTALFDGLSAGRSSRALTILARAALTDPRAYVMLDAVLTGNMASLAVIALQVAVETNARVGSSLEQIIDSTDLPLDSLVQVADALPFPSVALSGVAVAVLRQLTERIKIEPWQKASRLIEFSNWLTELDRRGEALATVSEAVSIYRWLISASSEDYTAKLANALNTQSNSLSAMGQNEEALQSIDEAVALRRTLVDQSASDRQCLRDLAVSLNNQSNRLSDMGKPAKAEVAISEAVDIERNLAVDEPEVFLPLLAASLNNKSNCLSELDRPEEALAETEEAIGIYRDLVQTRPDAFIARLAASLINKSCSLDDLGRDQEALEPLDEAIGYYRELAELQPRVVKPYMAILFSNRSEYLAKLHRYDEALAAIEETVTIGRSLTEDEPLAFTSHLAGWLEQQAEVLMMLGRDADAEDPRLEAARLQRRE